MLHGTAIEDLAFADLGKAFCLLVKIQDRAGKGLDRAYHTDLGSTERTADTLFEFCASPGVEKRHCYVIISLADKIEFAFKGYPIMARRKCAVPGVGLTALNLPVGDKLRDGAPPSLGLVINVPVTVPFEGSGTKRAGYEKSTDVDKVELLARFKR